MIGIDLSEYYVPRVRSTEKTEDKAFDECFKPLGNPDTCIRYQVKCSYCAHHGALVGRLPYRSICHKTGWQMRHVGNKFIVCDFYDANFLCKERAEEGIKKNRIGTGGFVGLTPKR